MSMYMVGVPMTEVHLSSAIARTAASPTKLHEGSSVNSECHEDYMTITIHFYRVLSRLWSCLLWRKFIYIRLHESHV